MAQPAPGGVGALRRRDPPDVRTRPRARLSRGCAVGWTMTNPTGPTNSTSHSNRRFARAGVIAELKEVTSALATLMARPASVLVVESLPRSVRLSGRIAWSGLRRFRATANSRSLERRRANSLAIRDRPTSNEENEEAASATATTRSRRSSRSRRCRRRSLAPWAGAPTPRWRNPTICEIEDHVPGRSSTYRGSGGRGTVARTRA